MKKGSADDRAALLTCSFNEKVKHMGFVSECMENKPLNTRLYLILYWNINQPQGSINPPPKKQ